MRPAPQRRGAAQRAVPLTAVWPNPDTPRGKKCIAEQKRFDRVTKLLQMLEARPALSGRDVGDFRIQLLLQQLKPFECVDDLVFPPTWAKRARKRRRAREEALGAMPKRGRIVAVDTAREAYTVQFDPDSEEEEAAAARGGGGGGAALNDSSDGEFLFYLPLHFTRIVLTV